jgi:AcrR family transcriptional regulator
MSRASVATKPHPKPSVPSTKSPRERILETADRLFYEQGSRAVGIDTIIAESGVAKMSLYRHFQSKDELIAACLEERNKKYWEWFDHIVGKHPGQPRKQLHAIFTAMAERTIRPGYRGCPFLHTASDYMETSHPGRRIAVEHKKTLNAKLLKICAQLEIRDPVALAHQLVLLINGAQATGGMLGRELQMQLPQAANLLIENQK